MLNTNLESLKASVLKDTLDHIEKKKLRNKTYIKLDLYDSKYYNVVGLSELDMALILEHVGQELILLGYKLDMDNYKITWE